MVNSTLKSSNNSNENRLPVSRTFYSQRLRLHYVEWVNTEAPPLIMVHGGSDHCRSWDWAARELSSKYNIVAPDLRGHGDSSWANGTYRKIDFVYDLKQLIAINGYKKVSIIAHSLGAWISLLYAGLNPDMVEKLVIIEGLLPVSPQHRARLEKPRYDRLNQWMELVHDLSSFSPKRIPSFELALKRIQSANKYLTDEQALHLTAYAVRQHEDGSYSWRFDPYLRSMNDSPELLEPEVLEIRSRIKCPVLLLQGDDSPFYMEEDNPYVQNLHDCTVINFHKASHWLHHEHLDRFLELTLDFLKS